MSDQVETSTAETRFGIFRLAPGIAWAPSAELSLGAAIGLNYAQARQKYFPESSVLAVPAEESLFGTRLDDLHASAINAIVGVSWKPVPWLVLAGAYRSETPVDLHGGKATVNFEALGAGQHRYEETRLEGFAIPQDLAIGFRAQVSPNWNFMAELQWINWSVVKSLKLRAGLSGANPNPLVIPSELSNVQDLSLKDQYAISFGVIRRLGEKRWLAAGYNYAKQPVPPRNLSPILAIVPQRHFTAGWGVQSATGWEFAVAAQYVPGDAIRYDNPTMRIGQDATERPEALQINLTFGREW